MRKLPKTIKAFILGICLTLMSIAALAVNQSPVGYWKTLDKGQPTSIIQITPQGNTLQGKVVKLYENPDAICTKCTGNMKDKPIMGATVLWGFHQLQNGNWSDGKVLAVKRGQVYDFGFTLSSDGQTMSVAVKTSLGDHLHTWERVSGPNG